MQAKNMLQWVGGYFSSIDETYKNQKNEFDKVIAKNKKNIDSLTDKISELENYLQKFIDLIDNNQNDNSNIHALFVEITVLMEEFNNYTNESEIIYRFKDGIIMTPRVTVSFGDDSINTYKGVILESGNLYENVKIKWIENDVDDHVILEWPNLPENLFFTSFFPKNFYFSKNDIIQIKRGKTFFVWRDNNHYHRIDIKPIRNIAIFPCDELREEYLKFNENKKNNLLITINAILQILN